jgi:hypothetical protein
MTMGAASVPEPFGHRDVSDQVSPAFRRTRSPGANVLALTGVKLFHAVSAEVPAAASSPAVASTK